MVRINSKSFHVFVRFLFVLITINAIARILTEYEGSQAFSNHNISKYYSYEAKLLLLLLLSTSQINLSLSMQN